MTDEQIAKLPKWARDEFCKLEADLREAREINERNTGEYDPRFPTYGDYDDLRGRALPCRHVWFRNAGITVRADGKAIHISGDGQLLVKPHVTNVLTISSDYIDERL